LLLALPIPYMGRMKAYFFDLDGTLADSRPGLYRSFRTALAFFGIPPVTDDKLAQFLGTPLPKMFRTFRPDLNDAEVEAGMQAFRGVYEETGINENELYPGAIEMLAAARERGVTTWIVTSKPEPQAVRVAHLLQLDRHVEDIIGAGLAETDTKTDLIARALSAAKVAANEALMVGDRHYDIVGANENRVLPVGALWGYGSYEELYAAGCRHFAQSPDDFRQRFIATDAGFAALPLPAAAVRA